MKPRAWLTRWSRKFRTSSLMSSVRTRIVLSVSLAAIFFFRFSSDLPDWLTLGCFVATLLVILRFWLKSPLDELLQLARFESGIAVAPEKIWRRRDEFARIALAVHSLSIGFRKSVQTAEENSVKLEEIFGAMGDGVAVVSLEGHVLQINSALRTWLGIAHDVRGMRLAEVIRSVALCERIEKMASLITEHNDHRIPPERIDELKIDAETERLVRAKIVAFRQGRDRVAFLVFLFDLSDIWRLQDMRREFLANASHELKTPISSIRGYAETLQNMPALQSSEVAQQFLGVIERNAEEMTALIDGMLQVAGLESGSLPLRLQPYDLADGLRRVSETLRPKASEAKVELRLEIAPGVDEIFVDPQRFDSLLLNLADNGIKYNRPGGFVRLAIRNEGDNTLLFVEDNGLGISEDVRNRVFERFYRGDKSHSRLGGGSGLGLSIAKHIVEAHGGTISLRSEQGVGSVFSVVLPRRRMRRTETGKHP